MFDKEPEIVADDENATTSLLPAGRPTSALSNVTENSQASNLSGTSERVTEQAKIGIESDDKTMNRIISSVVNKLSTTLQSLCVSDRVIEAQRSAQDWKELCKLMIANPELINEKLSVTQGPHTTFRRICIDVSDPSKISVQQFMSSPMSAPIWKFMVVFEIHQHDPILEKWWKSIKTDKDPWGKLCKYLQAVNNFLMGEFMF